MNDLIKRLKCLQFLCGIILLFIGKIPTAYSQDVGGAVYLLWGQQALQVDELNRTLKPQGLDGFSPQSQTFGAGGHLLLRKWVLGAEGHYLKGSQTSQTHTRSELTGAYGTFNVGYLLYQTETQQVYPLLGLGGGWNQFSVTSKKSKLTFSEALEDPLSSSSFSSGGPLLQVALAADHIWEMGKTPIGRGGLLMGMRIGYAYGPYQEWSAKNTRIEGIDPVETTGPFLRFVIGTGGSLFNPVNPSMSPDIQKH